MDVFPEYGKYRLGFPVNFDCCATLPGKAVPYLSSCIGDLPVIQSNCLQDLYDVLGCEGNGVTVRYRIYFAAFRKK